MRSTEAHGVSVSVGCHSLMWIATYCQPSRRCGRHLRALVAKSETSRRGIRTAGSSSTACMTVSQCCQSGQRCAPPASRAKIASSDGPKRVPVGRPQRGPEFPEPLVRDDQPHHSRALLSPSAGPLIGQVPLVRPPTSQAFGYVEGTRPVATENVRQEEVVRPADLLGDRYALHRSSTKQCGHRQWQGSVDQREPLKRAVETGCQTIPLPHAAAFI